jgi:hypothetical protein
VDYGRERYKGDNLTKRDVGLKKKIQNEPVPVEIGYADFTLSVREGSVTKFIISKFIRHKVYTAQSLYVTKFRRHQGHNYEVYT